MSPPSRGPTRIATGKAAPIMAMYRGRSRCVVTRAMMVCDISCKPAALMPWTTRAAISQLKSAANPQHREAMRKTHRAARKILRGPRMSSSLPKTGSRTVLARVYPTTIQTTAQSTSYRPEVTMPTCM